MVKIVSSDKKVTTTFYKVCFTSGARTNVRGAPAILTRYMRRVCVCGRGGMYKGGVCEVCVNRGSPKSGKYRREQKKAIAR